MLPDFLHDPCTFHFVLLHLDSALCLSACGQRCIVPEESQPRSSGEYTFVARVLTYARATASVRAESSAPHMESPCEDRNAPYSGNTLL